MMFVALISLAKPSPPRRSAKDCRGDWGGAGVGGSEPEANRKLIEIYEQKIQAKLAEILGETNDAA